MADISRLLSEIYNVLPSRPDTIVLTKALGNVGWTDCFGDQLYSNINQPISMIIKDMKKTKQDQGTHFVTSAFDWIEKCVSVDHNTTVAPIRPITLLLFLICIHIYENWKDSLVEINLFVSHNSLFFHLQQLNREFHIICPDDIPGLDRIVFQ